MKAIVIHPQTGNSPLSGGITIVPASAIVMPGKPLFLPDFGEEWAASAHPAYRLCRLGKTIDTKFAPRYVDAETTAYVMRPQKTDAPASVVAAADYSMALGTFSSTAITENHHICGIISSLSSYMTLQMGDVLVDASAPTPEIPVKKGDDLNGTRIR